MLPSPHAALLTPILAASICGCQKSQPGPVVDKESSVSSSAETSRRRVEQLVSARWDKLAAEKVVALNERFWTACPEAVDLHLARLQKLGEVPGLTPFLLAHPESASFLLSARDPAALAELLDGPDYDTLVGLFVGLPAEEDIDALARALGRYKALILRLRQRGLLGVEVVFLRTSSSDRAGVYDDWLAGEFEKRLSSPDLEGEELASFYHFVLDSGPALRDRLEATPRFAADFPELWRTLCRVVEATPGSLNDYLDEPGIWEALALPDSEKLLGQWGPLAIRLLTGPEAYAPSHRPAVRDALLKGDIKAVEALWKFRAERDFHQLLDRGMKPSVRVAVMQRLMNAGPDAPSEMRQMLRMTDKGLERHVGPSEEGLQTWLPLYSTYVVVEKLADGREVTALDWAGCLIDVVDVATIGNSKAVTTSLGQGAKVGAKVAAKSTAKTGQAAARRSFFRSMTRGVAQAAKQITRLKTTIDRHTAVDVTRFVQLAYTRSGMGRASFKRISGLEARLFMRRDARVRVHLSRMIDAKTLHDGAEKLHRFFAEQPADLDDDSELQSWRENVSGWWFLNASGQWETLKPPAKPLNPRK